MRLRLAYFVSKMNEKMKKTKNNREQKTVKMNCFFPFHKKKIYYALFMAWVYMQVC